MKSEEIIAKLKDLWEMMVEQFCVQYEVNRIKNEFHNLDAGTMTHRQYTSWYNSMARLLPHLVSTEKRRMECYIRGLPSKVRTFTKGSAPRIFESIVELSEIVWDDIGVSAMVDVNLRKEVLV